MNRILLVLFLLGTSLGSVANAQSNFSRVLSVIEDNGCASSTCHGNGAAGLWLTGSSSEIYDNLIDVESQNPISAARGYKIVKPGYPDQSTLYRKCNAGLYPSGNLLEGEGDDMPIGGTMSDLDKEILRQWILFGAPENGKAFSDNYFNAMEEYHTEGGIAVVEQPDPPAEGEGFQIYFGPLFLHPGEETEYSKKHQLDFPVDFEVNRIQNFMSDFSHHYIIYKFNSAGVSDGIKNGLRHISEDQILPTNQSFVSLWQENRNYELPEGTAYFWERDVALDLNYHVKNYSTSSVLAADCYVNVYTQEKGQAEKEMKSDLIINLGLNIPANGLPDTEVGYFNTGQDWNVWMLTSHTHQLGQDFDIYLREPDGSRGLQLYEGHHDTDYTFFTGYFDYAHPPVRYFDYFLKLESGQELIHEAVYINEGNSSVGFGVTTNDEMMITGVQYTTGNTHQNEPIINNLPFQLCVDADAVEILENYESGAIGEGVYGNLFYPDRAGVGVHEIMVGCCEDNQTQTFSIEVVGLPEAPTISPSINGLSTNPGYASYQWYDDGELIEGATGLSFAVESDGVYSVEVSNLNGCTIASDPYELSGTGIAQSEITGLNWSVAPNPSQSDFLLSLNLESAETVQISIFNMVGSEILRQNETELDAGENRQLIDLSEQPAGIYFLKIDINGESVIERILKQ